VETELLDITCPRCGHAASARRAALGGAQRDVEVAAYEPKMNVTPNAVATKD
jgi:hypothetical protein